MPKRAGEIEDKIEYLCVVLNLIKHLFQFWGHCALQNPIFQLIEPEEERICLACSIRAKGGKSINPSV